MKDVSEKQAAIADLLALPDPEEMPIRWHTWTVEGDPERYALIPFLRCASAEHAVVQRRNERMQ